MTDGDAPGGPLDVATLQVLARRAQTHPVVEGWAFQPDAIAPRRLELQLNGDRYPPPVEAARLDIRWYDGGDYTIHYREQRSDGSWECRWDRHPKPDAPSAHFHPPPDAAGPVEPSPITDTHHLGVLFAVLDWITEHIADLQRQ